MEITKINNSNLLSQVDNNLKSLNSSDKSEKKYNESTLNVKLKPDLNDLNSAVDKANKVLFKNNTHLQFRVHEKTKDVMVKIVDDVSGEVLKEIPPEKMLDLVAKLWEIAGIIVDKKA